MKLAETVAQQILEAVGELAPGTKLPPERELTMRLGVGRSTVREALNGLALIGVVEIRHGQGVFVAEQQPIAVGLADKRALPPREITEELLEARLKPKPALRIQSQQRSLSARGKVLAKTCVTVAGRPAGKMRPFIPGIPALDEFPIALWSRLISRRWRDESRGLMNYGPAAGYRPLREAIAAHLGPSRGVQCQPEQIIIVSGTQQALDLATRILIDPGDSVLVEDYCYGAVRAAPRERRAGQTERHGVDPVETRTPLDHRRRSPHQLSITLHGDPLRGVARQHRGEGMAQRGSMHRRRGRIALEQRRPRRRRMVEPAGREGHVTG